MGGGRDGQERGDSGVARRSSRPRPGQTGRGDPTPPEWWRKILALHGGGAWNYGLEERPEKLRHGNQRDRSGRSRRQSDLGQSICRERVVPRSPRTKTKGVMSGAERKIENDKHTEDQSCRFFQSIFTLDFQDIFNQFCVESTRLKLK